MTYQCEGFNMETVKYFKALLLTISIVLFSNTTFASSTPSTCDDPDNGLFISLSSDDVWKASMALNYAKKNLEFGPVTIFMNVTGTRIAVKENKLPHDFYALNRMTTQESLQAFLKAGGRGLVCPNCLERAGFKPGNLIKHKNLDMGMPELVRSELDCSNKQLRW